MAVFFVDAGVLLDQQYVTVVDDGHNPLEYSVPLEVAVAEYGDRPIYANPGEVPER